MLLVMRNINVSSSYPVHEIKLTYQMRCHGAWMMIQWFLYLCLHIFPLLSSIVGNRRMKEERAYFTGLIATGCIKAGSQILFSHNENLWILWPPYPSNKWKPLMMLNNHSCSLRRSDTLKDSNASIYTRLNILTNNGKKSSFFSDRP